MNLSHHLYPLRIYQKSINLLRNGHDGAWPSLFYWRATLRRGP